MSADGDVDRVVAAESGTRESGVVLGYLGPCGIVVVAR